MLNSLYTIEQSKTPPRGPVLTFARPIDLVAIDGEEIRVRAIHLFRKDPNDIEKCFAIIIEHPCGKTCLQSGKTAVICAETLKKHVLPIMENFDWLYGK